MKKYELEIVNDENPENPRTGWDNVTTMICFHNRYSLGDKHNYKSDNYDGWNELKEQIENDYKVLMIKPLYLYDHSGITISTSPFNCQWDSGQVGWVFIDEKNVKTFWGEEGTDDETLNRNLENDVEYYDKYLRGEAFGYRVYEIEECSLGHQHKNIVESCFGYYDEEQCEVEGKDMLKSYEKELELG